MGAFKSFISLMATRPIERSNEHEGVGPISFRRLLESTDFTAPVDFVDYTIIPPGGAIGRHQHVGNEEIYFIAAGSPLVRVNATEARLEMGSLAIAHQNDWHELINDSDQPVEILVIQIRT